MDSAVADVLGLIQSDSTFPVSRYRSIPLDVLRHVCVHLTIIPQGTGRRGRVLKADYVNALFDYVSRQLVRCYALYIG